MGENRSSTHRRSELELSTLPEVAALATELTLIFKSLEMRQQQYAIRTNYDKSYVSRFLNGRRVATQDFIDRLLREVENHRKRPVTEETRARLFHLRTAALRVYDPDLYELESIRLEAHRYQREVKRLVLHQEALEGLLERRQAEVNEARREIAQAQSDWVADRVQAEAEILALKGHRLRDEDERATLLEEISRLRQELKDTIALKEAAEQRCALLEEKAETVEIEVAEKRDREDFDGNGLSVESLRDVFLFGSDTEIYRQLVEFASSRPGSQVVEVALWLYRSSMKEYASQLLEDYCRQRAVVFSADLVREAEKQVDEDAVDMAYQHLISCVGKAVGRRPLVELKDFMEHYLVARRTEEHQSSRDSVPRIASVWLRSPAIKRRELQFFEVIDFLNHLGERDSADSLIRRQAVISRSLSRFMRAIAESDRRVEIETFSNEWLQRAAIFGEAIHHRAARQLNLMAEVSNPMMFDTIMDGLWDALDLSAIAGIFLYSSDGEGKNLAHKRLREGIVKRGLVGDVERIWLEEHRVQRIV